MKTYYKWQFDTNSFTEHYVHNFNINLDTKECVLTFGGAIIETDNKEARYLENVHLKVTGWTDVNIKWCDKILSAEEM
jgi:hypothetical protein